GQVAGREVVQVYLSAPASEVDKPSKELKAFAKTKLLAPGETQTVFLRLTAKDLASFVPTQSAWVADQGTYQVKVGSSSKQIQQTATFELDQALVVEQVHNVLNKDADFEDLKK
ncbi:MAG: fibronectin type III-like domain-contianing protein, partial [Bacteroides sp.]